MSSGSKAIGDIYLGIDKSTFKSKKEAFLKANPSLNGRKIEEMKGDFYKGKLYSITIRSEEFDDYWGSSMTGDAQKIRREWEEKNQVWTTLYKQKYKGAKNIKINGTDYIQIKNGRCTIEVSDKEHKLPSLVELKDMNRRLARGESVALKICSVIHIYDKSIESQIKKDEDKKKRQNKKKALDVI